MGPDNFQYVAQDARQNTVFRGLASGFSNLTNGVGDWFQDLDQTMTTARQKSPSERVRNIGLQIPRSVPAARSPTDFQYAPTSKTTTTVDIDGGSSLFSALRDAARSTLMTGLDNLTSRAEQGGLGYTPPVKQAAYEPPATIAGFPIAGVIAVGAVGAFVVWKYA